jgi:hypothetical protein
MCTKEMQTNANWFRNYKSTAARTETKEIVGLPAATSRALAA